MESRPRFEENEDGSVTIDDATERSLIFNASGVGPMEWLDLISTSYVESLREGDVPILPKLVPLIYSALENRKNFNGAKRVVDTMYLFWLVGNTVRLWGEEGLFVRDDPELIEGEISMHEGMNEKTFRGFLKRSGDGVYRSQSGLTRFAPYGFKVGVQSAFDLSKNIGLIATVGSEANANLIARASSHFGLQPIFRGEEQRKEPLVDIPGVGVDFYGCRLSVSYFPRGKACSFRLRRDVAA